jgi:hypothetical protein
MLDARCVSQTGARLRVEGSLEGVNLKQFFLLLSSTGLVYRRCNLVRVDGYQIGIAFWRETRAQKRRPQNNSLPIKSSQRRFQTGPFKLCGLAMIENVNS